MEFNSTSYFKQNFDVTAVPYSGIRFDEKAFVFPGQGSSAPGMFRVELKKHPEFQELFALADQFSESKGLGKVSDYINQHETIAKNNLPFIRNMALFTSQVALYRYLGRVKVTAQVLTAHSFGEYAVLTCAGALDFMTMLEVVYQRDVFSPAMNEVGTLVALSANESDFRKLQVPCGYEIANQNSDQQIVLAVAQKNLNVLSDFLKKNRIAARPMESVGRPYHSQWMQPAQESFKKWLSEKNLKLATLEVSVLSSVNRQFYPAGTLLAQEEFKTLLTEQLTRPVLFTEQSAALGKMGIHSFVELGLSTVCIGFIKTNLEQYDIVGLGAGHFLGATSDRKKGKTTFSIDTQNNKFFKLLSKYIGDITGYDINDISVGDSFQEDLQIDSIKKAEIVFRVLEGSRLTVGDGVSISQLHAVGDVVEYLEKIASTQQNMISKKVVQEFQLLTRQWVPSPAPVAPALKISSEQLIDVPISDGLKLPLKNLIEQLHAGNGKDLKIFVVRVQQAPPDFQNTPWIGELLMDFAELVERSPLTHQELKIVLYGQTDGPFFRGLKAFFKSLLKESKKFTFKSVLNEDQLDHKALIATELGDFQTLDVRYSKGQRLSLHFQEVQNDKTLQDAVIFSIGGTKGILKAVYQKFTASQNCHLFITGRSPAHDPAVVSALKKLKKRFKTLQYHQADARDPVSLQKAVEEITRAHGRIDLFINSAGREVSKSLLDQTPEEVVDQLNSKFDSLKNLLNIQKNFPKALILNFSSVVAHFGNEGQTVYSFANSYLDSFENCRHLHWPPMDGIGMTENPGILQKLRSVGISLMSEKEAARLFAQSLQFNTHISDLFFLDLKDLYLYEYHLRNPMEDRRVFGDLMDPTRLTFAKSYDLKNDSYLRDHHIESTSVVAAATGIAAFMNFGAYCFKSIPVLENFEIKNMILVTDRDNICLFQPEFISTQEISMKLVSQVEHFTGSIKASPKVRTHEKMAAFKGTQSIAMSSFYSVRSIDYGPKFQVIEKAFYDQNLNVVAIGKKNVPYLTGMTLNDYASYLIELAFQAIYLKNVLLGKGLGIPLRINKIEPGDFHLSENVYAVPSAYTEGSDERMIYGGAKIYNDKGQLILNIEGVEMSTIRLYEAPPFESKADSWEFRGI
jgi:[acyl-carrier-protein] S-malonyltransferase